MRSIQDREEKRGIALERVGVTDVVRPILVRPPGGDAQTATATVALFVGLDASKRGAHMSRFLEILQKHAEPSTPDGARALLEDLRESLGARTAAFELDFVYFVSSTAPISRRTSPMACRTTVEAALDDDLDYVLTVEAPVMTVCPCSSETTGMTGHSQRGHVAVSVRYRGELTIEELVQTIEDSASSPVYPLSKRDDERAIIERAAQAPALVEDLARNVAERLDSDVRITWYRVEAKNLESIHDHNVYACVERSHEEDEPAPGKAAGDSA